MESGSETPAAGGGGGGDRVLGGAPARLPGLDFYEWSRGLHPARLAALYELVVVAGDDFWVPSLVAELQALGVEAVHYPLRADDAPTVYSALGVAGLLAGARRAAVVDAGPGALLAALHALVNLGYSLSDVAGVGLVERLTSPLHYRLLVLLDSLRGAGVDLSAEAERCRTAALTGGDAAASDRILIAFDLERGIPRLAGCAARLYLGDGCPELEEVLDALDPHGEGGVAVAALERLHGRLVLHVGCRFMPRGDPCLRERAALAEAARLLSSRGPPVEPGEILYPEEAACIAYGDGYPCT
ncbi:MAG: hypothetical protein GXO15_00320 [Crenarchaeota archaeon]|nr:hypothetical protein [Thermoproteota archaeon]